MWEYEVTAEAEVSAQAVWQLWADPLGWHAWNDGVGEVELNGPFAAGSTFTMVPPGQDKILMTLTEVTEGRAFVDVAEGPGIVVTTHHLIDDLGDGRTRVTYRTEITGDAADELGPRIGPEICGDFEDVVAKLLTLAAAA
ncbi:SRPBCC family protein [Catenulispora yoronensis]|uniref:SRPBCC family protein n=1 Tax=Catenulispora yoronensis TaxID=450799 RepID=A0ABP5FT21_9ACTN